MEKNTSEWLDLDFLNHSIRSKEKYKNYFVTNFTVTSAVPPGNNFGSCLLRVNLNYKDDINNGGGEGSLSLIVKTLLEMFENIVVGGEPMFYNEYMLEANTFIDHPFITNSFSSSIPSVVVLEDLKTQGYVMCDRTKQLDFEHCKAYLTAAATFHAASHTVHKNNPRLIKSIGSEKCFSNDLECTKYMKKMCEDGMRCMAYHLSELCYKTFSSILEDCSDTLWDMIVEAHKPNQTLNTLNQGDPWTTNMMFKYDNEGKVIDFKLLDFQCLKFTSPVIDIVFFVWMSANHDVRKHFIPELYHIYIEKFNRNVMKLGYPNKVTYDNFMEQVEKLSQLVIFMVSVYIPMCLGLTPPDIHDIMKALHDDLASSQHLIEKFYDDSYCQTHLPQFVDALDSAGVFEYLRKNK